MWWTRKELKKAIKAEKDTTMQEKLEGLLKGVTGAMDSVRNYAVQTGRVLPTLLAGALPLSAQDANAAADAQAARPQQGVEMRVDSDNRFMPLFSKDYYRDLAKGQPKDFKRRDQPQVFYREGVEKSILEIKPTLDRTTEAYKITLDKMAAQAQSSAAWVNNTSMNAIAQNMNSYLEVSDVLASSQVNPEYASFLKGHYLQMLKAGEKIDGIAAKEMISRIPKEVKVFHIEPGVTIDKYILQVLPEFTQMEGNRQKRICDKIIEINAAFKRGIEMFGSRDPKDYKKYGLNVKPKGYQVLWEGSKGPSVTWYDIVPELETKSTVLVIPYADTLRKL